MTPLENCAHQIINRPEPAETTTIISNSSNGRNFLEIRRDRLVGLRLIRNQNWHETFEDSDALL